MLFKSWVLGKIFTAHAYVQNLEMVWRKRTVLALVHLAGFPYNTPPLYEHICLDCGWSYNGVSTVLLRLYRFLSLQLATTKKPEPSAKLPLVFYFCTPGCFENWTNSYSTFFATNSKTIPSRHTNTQDTHSTNNHIQN